MVTAASAVAFPVQAWAQAPATTPPAAPAGQAALAQPAPLTAGWQNGFALQTANGDYRLLFSGVVQLDGRFSVDDPLPITNTFTIRKARPIISGRLAKYFDFRIMPELGNGSATLLDAYFDIRFSPAFRIRNGKDKTPLGYELLQGDGALVFPERSLVSSLVPNRDIGIQVQGDVAGGKLFYAGGVFNGVPDGTSTTTELDTNSGKDLVGRIVVTPFRSSRTPAGALNNLGFNLGGSTGTQAGALPSFRTSVGQTFFSYAPAPNATTAAGARRRVSPAVFLYYKAFGVIGEYACSTQEVVRQGTLADVTNDAWQVSGAFFLTGETASYGLPTPRRPFDLANGQWGALQVAARYAVLNIDGQIFGLGLAAPNTSRKAEQVTVALNWYPAGVVKYYTTFERTIFDGNANGPRPAENVVLFRAQLAF